MDNRSISQETLNSGCFKEAVCINAERIYDSCSSKDCLEDLRVYFPDCDQTVINQARSVRIKKAQVITTYLDMEPVTFNRGFYSVDLTMFFRVTLEAVTSPMVPAQNVSGVAVFNKKVILYGSCGSVKVYTSECAGEGPGRSTSPKAIVQVADPIGLSARLCDPKCCGSCCACGIPESIRSAFGGTFDQVECATVVLATIGVFSIVQLVRDVQMLIPAYDFCIPEKECVNTTENPCEMFSKIDFPTGEFFPPRMDSDECGACSCDS